MCMSSVLETKLMKGQTSQHSGAISTPDCGHLSAMASGHRQGRWIPHLTEPSPTASKLRRRVQGSRLEVGRHMWKHKVRRVCIITSRGQLAVPSKRVSQCRHALSEVGEWGMCYTHACNQWSNRCNSKGFPVRSSEAISANICMVVALLCIVRFRLSVCVHPEAPLSCVLCVANLFPVHPTASQFYPCVPRRLACVSPFVSCWFIGPHLPIKCVHLITSLYMCSANSGSPGEGSNCCAHGIINSETLGLAVSQDPMRVCHAPPDIRKTFFHCSVGAVGTAVLEQLAPKVHAVILVVILDISARF